jgi:COP9 signalosome complex subunit 5
MLIDDDDDDDDVVVVVVVVESFQNRDYTTGRIGDLSEKLEQAETQLAHSGRIGTYLMHEKKKEESQLSKIMKDSCKVSIDQCNGLMSQVIKNVLFNLVFTNQNKDPVKQ